ncbi:S-layer homology domain-containing protein [Rossellomorea oryzaecorticis]|uniref:S-layer homology domain-containing protein n=1 Tax=Rossellomorea oryzaecorticis TaxID=1396505 RepID=A0ABW8VU22_9BACI
MKKGFITLLVVALAFASLPFTAAAASFKDIGGTYAKEYIEVLSQKNIISGYNDGTYRPQEKVTRAQFAKMLALALELPGSPDAAKGFKDVKDWADPHVGALVEAGVTKGIRPDFFGADNPITRQEMIVMFVRAMGMEPYAVLTNPISGFDDEAKISQFAYNHVAFAEAIGFAEGSNNSFMPTTTADRAAAAKWIYNFTIDEEKYFNRALSFIVGNTMTLENAERAKKIDEDTVRIYNFDRTTEDRDLVEFMNELMVRLNYEYLYFLDGMFWNESAISVKSDLVNTAMDFWQSEYSGYTLKVSATDASARLTAHLNEFFADEENVYYSYSILEEMLFFAEDEGIIEMK